MKCFMKHLKYIGTSNKLFLINVDILKTAPRLTKREIKYLIYINNIKLSYRFEPIFNYIKQQLTIAETKALLTKNPELLEIFI